MYVLESPLLKWLTRELVQPRSGSTMSLLQCSVADRLGLTSIKYEQMCKAFMSRVYLSACEGLKKKRNTSSVMYPSSRLSHTSVNCSRMLLMKTLSKKLACHTRPFLTETAVICCWVQIIKISLHGCWVPTYSFAGETYMQVMLLWDGL